MARTTKAAEQVTPLYPHPRSMGELFGHEEAEKVLLNAYQTRRLHHAWLLSGIEGIGKATLAYRMARFVLAHPDQKQEDVQEAQSLFVPEHDNVFHQLAQNTHPDCHTLEQAEEKTRSRKSISVDAVRHLNERMLTTSSGGGWRAAIIDSVDDLNSNAANALLKLLEEPPQQCLFLLISHQPGELMATLRSRCQKLHLNPLEDAQLVKAVHAVMPGLHQTDIEKALPYAYGSVRAALDLVTGAGFAERDMLRVMLDNLPRIDVKPLQQLADAIARKGEEAFSQAIELIVQWCHDLTIQQPEVFFASALAGFSGNLVEEARRVSIFNLDRKAFLITRLTALARLLRARDAA
jgi:DNA polymerase-3 subunit delta'